MPTDATKGPPQLDPNRAAAHYFLCELRTRISTQPLPYQHGVEARALASLREVFDQAREAMKKYPGCDHFAAAVTDMLNTQLRPITAKWHRPLTEGRLNSRDGADEFRGDLNKTQEMLREFARSLHWMAYGRDGKDEPSPPVIKPEELKNYFAKIPFGIEGGDIIDTPTTTAINKDEAAAVDERRERHEVTTEKGTDAIGLALSGGGIRSATFCLGVVQVLAERNLFKDIDFLSTVSGGGYVGCFITTRLGKVETGTVAPEIAAPGITPEAVAPEAVAPEAVATVAEPTATSPTVAVATDRPRTDAPTAAIAGPDGPDPSAIRYLRRHAKYLAALDLKQAWLMVSGTLAGMLLNWTAPLSVVTLAAALVSIYGWLELPKIAWRYPLALLAIASVIKLFIYGARLPAGRETAAAAGRCFGRVLALTILIGVLWLLQYLYKPVIDYGVSGSLFAAAVIVAPAIIRFIPVLKNPAIRKIALKALLLLAAVVVPLGAILLFYFLVHVGSGSLRAILSMFVAGAAFAAFAFRFLNINLTGPHRLYRDQLAGTFVQSKEDDSPVELSSINASKRAPYHLINTTLNVPSSTAEVLRERKSDFFLFSKSYCGSPATRYLPTKNWKVNGKPPDLATAMAISGAAASSYMGLGSMPTLTALLTLLNVRLGFWILHPQSIPIPPPEPTPAPTPALPPLPASFRDRFLPVSFPDRFKSEYPGFGCLIREMFGFRMSENQAWLNLSDGGHIENLGIYELLRRRCKLIISVDGEADPAYTFQGLMTLVRHAQIDFGARIEVNLSDIRPDPKTGYSQAHTALCIIRYPDKSLGFMIYMKLSVTGNELEMIRRYRINHPDFPHQTTLDQFFDEEQFEVYRQLGAHVATGLFSPALMGGETIENVPQWFRQLVRNLLPKPITDYKKPSDAPATPAAGPAPAPG